MPDTSTFIETQIFKRYTKVNFNARMTKAVKNLATKSQIETALDLGY